MNAEDEECTEVPQSGQLWEVRLNPYAVNYPFPCKVDGTDRQIFFQHKQIVMVTNVEVEQLRMDEPHLHIDFILGERVFDDLFLLLSVWNKKFKLVS